MVFRSLRLTDKVSTFYARNTKEKLIGFYFFSILTPDEDEEADKLMHFMISNVVI